MNSPLVRCRKVGSCVAGLLIGLSIVIAVFAVMEENSSDWLTILLFGSLVLGAPIVFGLGQTSVRLSAQPKTHIERGTLLSAKSLLPSARMQSILRGRGKLCDSA